jgi:hypothetical protein
MAGSNPSSFEKSKFVIVSYCRRNPGSRSKEELRQEKSPPVLRRASFRSIKYQIRQAPGAQLWSDGDDGARLRPMLPVLP